MKSLNVPGRKNEDRYGHATPKRSQHVLYVRDLYSIEQFWAFGNSLSPRIQAELFWRWRNQTRRIWYAIDRTLAHQRSVHGAEEAALPPELEGIDIFAKGKTEEVCCEVWNSIANDMLPIAGSLTDRKKLPCGRWLISTHKSTEYLTLRLANPWHQLPLKSLRYWSSFIASVLPKWHYRRHQMRVKVLRPCG